jgi:hypothetical protein
MKIFKFNIALLCALVLFTGCGMNNTTKGGLIGAGGGAALGALAGKLIGNSGKSTAIGAAIGTAVGTTAGVLIGKKMDKAKAEAVRHMEIYKDCYAISFCPSAGLQSPTIVGAQAANELLNVAGIKASFVFTYYNNEVYISARSIDEVNVQIIMERLGGGGHINTAGTQFQHTDMEEAVKALKLTIDNMIAEGDI